MCYEPVFRVNQGQCGGLSRSDIKTRFSAPVFSEDIHPTEATHYQVSHLYASGW